MKRKKAVFTIMQDETWLIDKWLQYYCSNFDMCDIYMLTHKSLNYKEDGRLMRGCLSSCKPIPVFNDLSFDHEWLKTTVCLFQRFLLQSYEYVLFTEIDEFVVPDPDKYVDLDDYIRKLNKPQVTCNGYEIQHVPEIEPSLTFSKGVMSQRQYWHKSKIYSKTLLANHPLDWSKGFHCVANVKEEVDEDLYFIHFKKADFDLLLKKNIDAMHRKWSKYDLEHGHGIQHHLTDKPSLSAWFESFKPFLEPIPDRFKKESLL